MENYNEAITLTFGDQAENHKGMEKYGVLSEEGITVEELNGINEWFKINGAETILIELHNLLNEDIKENNEACLLIIKNGINILVNDNEWSNLLIQEQSKLKKDKKAYMYGRVVNKIARHNLCFSEKHLEADYENGRGTVYSFEEVPYLNTIREKLGDIGYDKIKNLQIEGNYYYDTRKCGIGWHGDSERRIVVGVRLGKNIPLCFRWYYNNEPITEILQINDLEHGDIYIMSEKAVGTDWKKKKSYTLRHSAGCEKYIKGK